MLEQLRENMGECKKACREGNWLGKLPLEVAAKVAGYTGCVNAYNCQEVAHILKLHPLPYVRIDLNFQPRREAIPDEIEAETCRNWNFEHLKELRVCFMKKINKSIVKTILTKAQLNCFKVQCKELSASDALYACRFMPHAKQFHICHTELNNNDTEMTEMVRASMVSNDKLENLLLSWTNFGPELGRALQSVIRTNQTLKVLYLGKTSLGDEGVATLSSAIAQNTTITTLNLRQNGISPMGAKHLCESLKENTGLRELFLNLNTIMDQGAMYLADALKVNKMLRIVQLCSNDIGSDGAAALGAALMSNTSLRMLNMNNNKIKDKGSVALCEALKVNKCLAELYLKNCNIADEGSESFASALRVNRRIDILDLRDNSIYVDGGAALKDAIVVNKHIQGILLGFNYVPEETLSEIEAILQANKREDFKPLWCGRGHSACTLSFFLQYYNN